MQTIFTAWGYEVTYLELASVITSLVAVILGARGTRWAWPWWVISSSLYSIFFYNVDLLASSILQLIFIAAAIWGWFGWKRTGVEPRYMSKKERAIGLVHSLLYGQLRRLCLQRSAPPRLGRIPYFSYQARLLK